MTIQPRHHRSTPRRAWRPAPIEALEGRQLLTASPLAPNFNGGQVIVDPSAPAVAPATATSLNSGTAVAVQADGKIVVVGAIVQPNGSQGNDGLAVRRYNQNGTLDTSFGTNGEADVALPAVSYNAVLASSQVLIQADGGIVFAADLATRPNSTSLPAYSSRFTSVETVAVRLSPAGTLDSTFGTGGETVISTMAANLTDLALDSSGKIVLAGMATQASSNYPAAAVTRLNTDGSVDTTFNSGNLLTRDLTPYGTSYVSVSLAVAPTTSNVVLTTSLQDGYTGTPNYVVAEYNANGTLNTSFGSGGTIQGNNYHLISATAVQSDGKILLAGLTLARLNSDGSVDSTFAAPSISGGTTAFALQADGKILIFSGQYGLTRFTASGVTDGSFGPGGHVHLTIAPPPAAASDDTIDQSINSIAVTASGQPVVTGTQRDDYRIYGPGIESTYPRSSQLIVAQFKATNPVAGDYDGDGKADIAAELTTDALYAYRKSTGTGDVVQQFGQAGLGKSIPAPGDYDGDGKTDVAVYIPISGMLAYRSSLSGKDVLTQFGPPGIGAAIPAPGDYDGDGITDIAVYIPRMGAFAIRPSSGAPSYFAPFGTPGAYASIPAPGDYDGDGKTDLAVYLPGTGTLAYRASSAPSGTVNDVLTQFGPAGFGNSIPAPGDYDGDGKTDIAVYIPSEGAFAIHPSYYYSSNYLVPFGVKGMNASIPAPGDYDGDGKTDLAVYLYNQGSVFAYRSSAGRGDVVQQFGLSGIGQTIPASALPFSQATGGSGNTSAATPSLAASSAAVYIPLTDDLTSSTSTSSRKPVLNNLILGDQRQAAKPVLSFLGWTFLAEKAS